MSTVIPPEKGDEKTPLGPVPPPTTRNKFQWVYVVGALVVIAILAIIGFAR